ncbi:acyl carrier protein [Plantibacter sp. RU18]|uniref:acyl carrier protein n=1 Tax=Plantibacter sp. RU18 TaxID=3158143 RepID=UPI003D35DB42
MENLVQFLKTHLAADRGVDEDKVEVLPTSTLRDDLDIDSLATVELTMELESTFGVVIDDADVFEAVDVNSLLSLLSQSAQA